MIKFKSRLKLLILRLSKVRFMNRWVVFALDVALAILSTLFVLLVVTQTLRYTVSPPHVWQLSALSLVSTVLSMMLFKSYANVIRYSTLREIWRLLLMVVVKEALFGLILSFTLLLPGRQLLFLCADFFVTFVALLSFRIFLLNVYNVILLSTYSKKKNILIYGVDDESVKLAQGSTKVYMTDHLVRGFLLMDSRKHHYLLSGQRVYSVSSQDELKKIVVHNNIDGILFPNMALAQKEEKRLIRFCEQLNLRVLVVPNPEEMKDGVLHRSIRRINIEDLLGRDEIKINMKEIGSLLQGKCVLVTGAAGSIGSEICRQLAKFDVRYLVCFDMGETPMHNLRLELEEKFPRLKFIPVIGDVRSQERLEFAFRTYHPQVVFHAAAYKHVPLMEENPCEAIRVNVYGTRNVADIAVKYGIEKFVMVSTDKAVNPTNIMGCSKRLAEIYVQSLNRAIQKGEVQGKTKFITTRFGNVLGSNGSVIPRFKEQIKNGGPVTVTHPDIIRFFMTIPEACRLVLEAGTMGDGGEIFVFDMGEPVKIADLARRMIELSGFRPDKDIEIKYTGLRPGEKLYEEVLSDEENTKETPHPKIKVAAVREYDYQEVLPHIELLTRLSTEVRIPDMVIEMKNVVPEFKSKNSVYEMYDKK